MKQDDNTPIENDDAAGSASSASGDGLSPGNEVDAASIDALSTGSDSGEYVRDGAPVKKDEVEEKSPETGSESPEKKEDDFFIPVLRTYQGDTKDVAETKGGVELRTVLAKEAEEKRKAQQEYLKKTREVMKESAVLKDSIRNFSKKKSGGEILTEVRKGSAEAKREDVQHINKSVSGALAYMQAAQAGGNKEVEQDEFSAEKKSDLNNKGRDADAVSPDLAKTIKSVDSAFHSQAKPHKKKGVFSQIRDHISAEDAFSDKEREAMREQQKDIVEKSSLESAWKGFQRKKREVQEQGFAVRDVRSYSASADTKPPKVSTLKQFLLIGVIVVLVGSLISSVVLIAMQALDTPGSIPVEPKSVRDVIGSERKVFVDVSATPDTWPNISKRGSDRNVVNKFVPYEMQEGKSVQVDLDEFNINFIMRIPPGLRETFGDYYFVGNYVDANTVYGIFIVSVKNYSDALVWMLNWEKNAINSFISVFPGIFNRSNPENTSVTSKIVDNKDVRILQNPLSDTPLLYYFFNRSFLVFVVGGEDVVSIINDRIISANAQ